MFKKRMADIVSSHSHFTDTLCGRYGVADIDLWPISTLLVADMVFCVADMVVADIVCGRYRRFPSRKLITRANHFEFLDELYFLETRNWGSYPSAEIS